MKYGVLDSLDKIQKFENTYSQICFANLSDITPYQCFSWVYNYAKYFIGQNEPPRTNLKDSNKLQQVVF